MSTLQTIETRGGIEWTPDQISLVKKTVAKDATNDELSMFLHLAKTYGLDPFAKEIWFIKQGGQPLMMTSRDGYLKIANEHPDFEGLVSDVVYAGDQFERNDSGVKHVYGMKDRGAPVGAYALIYRKGRRFPVYVFAPYKDYAKGNNVWRTYPHAMILKVAEAMALKRAFSLSGLVTREEIDDSDENERPSNAPSKPANAPKEEQANPNSDRLNAIWHGYMEVCGNKPHAVNAIKQVVGDRKKEEWTDADLAALESDIERRRADAEETPMPGVEEPAA